MKIAIFSRLISVEFERAGGILASSRFELIEREVVFGIVYRRIGQRRRWAFGWSRSIVIGGLVQKIWLNGWPEVAKGYPLVALSGHKDLL